MLGCAFAAFGCESLSYPEPEATAGSPGGAAVADTHTATPVEQGAWVELSADGRAAMRTGDLAAAEAAYVSALAETSVFPIHDARVRTALGNLLRVAAAWQARNDFAAAESSIGHVVRSADAGRLADFGAAAPVFSAQAAARERGGDVSGAIALYDTLLVLHGVEAPSLVGVRLEAQSTLGRLLLADGRAAEAEALFSTLLQRVQSRFGVESREAVRALVQLAEARAANGDVAGAERDLVRAVDMLGRVEESPLSLAVLENHLAMFYLEHGRAAEAQPLAAASVARFDANEISGAPLIASLDTLAIAEAALGRDDEAARSFSRALALYDVEDPATRGTLVELLDHYAAFERRRGRATVAFDLERRAARERAAAAPIQLPAPETATR